MPTDLEGTELIVEKLDRKEFIDLLKRMLALNQEKRITPDEALNHPFITFSHLIDYAHSHRCVFDKFVVKTSPFLRHCLCTSVETGLKYCSLSCHIHDTVCNEYF